MASLPSNHRSNVLRCYRELLGLIKRLPAQEVAPALQQARDEVRAHAGESNPVKALDHLKAMVGRISFLRITTPRLPRDRNRTGGRFVLREGKLVEGQGMDKGDRVADGTLSKSEAYDMHRRLMKRQYYGREPPKFNEPM